jgi:hypothetical protein
MSKRLRLDDVVFLLGGVDDDEGNDEEEEECSHDQVELEQLLQQHFDPQIGSVLQLTII